ncbi:bifunctional lysylphosphatidylglycerol flippase/synthetase MprF [Hoeflea alexandrii]|uniref:Phosphatidylglycerol lysyltransferase n=1 Tax=Hoeflea alexandrii TaxID=288436 RepID=A0ABT1CZD3_9HYPH|nr:bifunctional lysylphosphatidylglycerol flippase/synthetase MprF [Hoeflea alexandrii]MCO6410900.1 bifunctional lysylphosphatidylglycerol flippase/synthetase MprF [Hoeflea alexandrii]
MTSKDTQSTDSVQNTSRLLKNYGSLLASLLLFGLGAFAVYKTLHGIAIADVITQLDRTSRTSLALAVAATAGGYLALVGYDWSALRFIGRQLPVTTVALGSFTAYALSNSIGLAVLSGGAVRYRFYRGLGLSLADIAVVSTYCAMAFGVGVTLVGFAALAWHPAALESIVPLASTSIRYVSIAIFTVTIALVLWGSFAGRAVGIGRFSGSFPPPRDIGLQIAFSLFDIVFAAATLYLLLPAEASATIHYSTFVAVFAVAAVAAVLSHVPGGIGVFEAVILGAFSSVPDQTAGIAAALLGYRFVYYLLPLLMGVLILVVLELRSRRKVDVFPIGAARPALSATMSLTSFIPGLAAALTFLAGAILVLNGLVPIPASILDELKPAIPAGLFEVSNIVMAMAGGVLIVIANGLRAQSRSALYLVIGILGVAIGSLLLQRLDYDLVLALALLAGLLWLSRGHFERRTPISLAQRPVASFALWAAFSVCVALFFLFAHQDAEYSHSRWWQFAFDANMPRALRMAGVSISVSLILLLFFALRPKPGKPSGETPDSETLYSILSKQDDADANFALTGDKSFLVSERNDAFIMYGQHGRSFVALGSPVGDGKSAVELIDAFVTAADQANCRPAFYQIADKDLARFVDAGFVPSKLGEEAVVNLETFTLDGPQHRSLRQAYNRSMRAGLTLEISAPPHAPVLLAALRDMSNEWLEEKKTREKGFSLGRFDEDYLQNFRLAVVYAADRPVAFANIFETATKRHATIDLMRHLSNAPSGTMDFLFVSVMLTLKAEGFGEFSLGMAPLTGLDATRHPRMWDRAAGSVYRFGGHFYNFAGLRAYKDKFDPTWRSRYLMTWGGIDPLLVANDINAIVSGGLRGAISRGRRDGAAEHHRPIKRQN